jgi:hypothetical protein
MTRFEDRMIKVVVGKLGSKKTAKRGAPVNVKKRQVRQADGRSVRVFTLDANSPTFDDDLTYVYSANVADARRENVKLFGSADGTKPMSGKAKPSSGHARAKT